MAAGVTPEIIARHWQVKTNNVCVYFHTLCFNSYVFRATHSVTCVFDTRSSEAAGGGGHFGCYCGHTPHFLTGMKNDLFITGKIQPVQRDRQQTWTVRCELFRKVTTIKISDLSTFKKRIRVYMCTDNLACSSIAANRRKVHCSKERHRRLF